MWWLFILLVIFAILMYAPDKIGGDRSRSEQEIIQILESITGKPFHQAHPKWLTENGAALELDGYNPELKVAIEFQGPLHSKWYPEKEPYTKYLARISRDELKRQLCADNGVRLIVFDYGISRTGARDYLASRLSDFGIVERPINYTPEIRPSVFRNATLETNLKLNDI